VNGWVGYHLALRLAESGFDFDRQGHAHDGHRRVVGLEPNVGVPVADRCIGADACRNQVADFRPVATEFLEGSHDIVTGSRHFGDLPLSVPSEGNSHGSRGHAPLFDLAEPEARWGDLGC
jgi:hypothetical protein